MLAPRTFDATFRFPVGTKFCTARLSFERGEDAGEAVRHFMLAENIPVRFSSLSCPSTVASAHENLLLG